MSFPHFSIDVSSLRVVEYNHGTKPSSRVVSSKSTGQEVNLMENDNMTQAELILLLATLAENIEAKAKSAEEAAQIIRDKIEFIKSISGKSTDGKST